MLYAFAKKLFSTALNCFYSRVYVHGDAGIPENQAVLFISNHSNAFIDPLLLTSHMDRPVTFTAKSTLSKNPLLRVILKAFSVELLLRQSDKTQSDNLRAHNSLALHRLQQRLLDNGAVYIFPEGRSHDDRQLREFKTGAARLALSFAQQNKIHDADKDLLIVPLGLAYENKSAFRSTASIQFGEPLSLRTWTKEHPDADARVLTDQLKSMVETTLYEHKLRARRKALFVHTPTVSTEETGIVGRLAQLCRGGKRLVLTPLVILGSLLNALPLAITTGLVRLLSTDHDHPASAAIVVGPPVFVITHAVLLLVAAVFGSVFLAISYLLLLIPCTKISIKALDRFLAVSRTVPITSSQCVV